MQYRFSHVFHVLQLCSSLAAPYFFDFIGCSHEYQAMRIYIKSQPRHDVNLPRTLVSSRLLYPKLVRT